MLMMSVPRCFAIILFFICRTFDYSQIKFIENNKSLIWISILKQESVYEQVLHSYCKCITCFCNCFQIFLLFFSVFAIYDTLTLVPHEQEAAIPVSFIIVNDKNERRSEILVMRLSKTMRMWKQTSSDY